MPDFMEDVNVHTVYKNKGPKTDFNSYRGLFILSVLRTIKEKIVHSNIYDKVQESMSDSQVGATKGRSIRNHLFVLNSVLNEVKQTNKSGIDIQIYDVRKCFDELSLTECVNDLYEAGVQDDKLNSIYNGNINNNMAVKVPSIGLTERKSITKKVTQGGPFGPTMCAVSIDKIGKETIQRNEYNYIYKENIKIPPLSLIDDLLTIVECGCKSVEVKFLHIYSSWS